jgi:hypothetical protein
MNKVEIAFSCANFVVGKSRNFSQTTGNEIKNSSFSTRPALATFVKDQNNLGKNLGRRDSGA